MGCIINGDVRLGTAYTAAGRNETSEERFAYSGKSSDFTVIKAGI
jgi:hypothetical protein